MTTPVLEVEAVSLERGGQRVLDDVSFAVIPEERVLVRGPSGSGKTSLFEVMGLLAKPASGTVRVDDTDVTTLGERGRARLRRETIGFVFQDFQLVPDLTVRENARLPQEHTGEIDDDWITTLLQTLGIAELAERYPHELSGGEKQRVAIARALANRPAVVLADEPTGQLDPDATDRVLDLLLRVREETAAALVVVSHDRQLGDHFETVRHLVDGQIDARTTGTDD